MQTIPQLPPRQTGEPFCGIGHTLPHLPQFALSESTFKHCLPQAEYPALHAIPQLPLWHDAAPFEGIGQALPQSPQFSGLVATSTHAPPQFFCVPLQLSEHTPFEQAWPVGQALPQAPQLPGSWSVATQTSPHLA